MCDNKLVDYYRDELLQLVERACRDGVVLSIDVTHVPPLRMGRVGLLCGARPVLTTHKLFSMTLPMALLDIPPVATPSNEVLS